MKKNRQILILLCFFELCVAFSNMANAVESHAVVLMYHRFDESKYPSTNIQVEQFLAQLDFLEKNKFQVWPLEKIIEYLQSRRFIPDKVVAITVDDAYLSVYQVAYPILKKRNLPFTVFVATQPLDDINPGYMRWDHLREMVQSGVGIGNHSRTHLQLVNQMQNERKDDWLQRIKDDVSFAANRLNTELKIKPVLFAYPYGEYNLEIAEIIKKLGYISFGQHSGAIGEKSDLRFLPRFPMSESFADLAGFKDKVFSLPMPVFEQQPLEVVTSLPRPMLEVQLATSDFQKEDLQCFISNQGAASIDWKSGQRFAIQASKPIVARRARYNCTLRKNGRFYWYSHLWIQPELPELMH